MRRKNNPSETLSSDSFLDIIANMVGILIILIVIVGVKVRYAPPPQKTGAAPAAVEQVAVPPVPAQPVVSAEPVELAEPDYYPPVMFEAEPEPPVVPPPAPLPLAALVQPRELISETEAIDREIAALRQQAARLVQDMTAANQLEAQLRSALERKQALLTGQQKLATERREREQQNAAELEALRREMLELVKQVRVVETATPEIKTLEHRITPISRQVEGTEYHFRFEKNQVSVVPLNRLIERLKDQIERRKDVVLRTSRYVGQIGPVDGYSMQYVMERQGTSVLDELRHGVVGYRIGVSEWQILPEPELVPETSGQALKEGSRFLQALVGAEEGATLTFWVYPDSFEAYKVLQKFAHDYGFFVAGRPLPHGIPISGSPNGSRSTAQ